MQTGSHILELRLETDNRNNCCFSLASELSVNYYYQNCPSVDPKIIIQKQRLNRRYRELKKECGPDACLLMPGPEVRCRALDVMGACSLLPRILKQGSDQ